MTNSGPCSFEAMIAPASLKVMATSEPVDPGATTSSTANPANGFTDAEYADKLIRDGKVDLVAVGRALWSDPKWAEKAVETLKT